MNFSFRGRDRLMNRWRKSSSERGDHKFDNLYEEKTQLHGFEFIITHDDDEARRGTWRFRLSS